MKNYTITVNGKAYNVTVEEGQTTQTTPVQTQQAAPTAPKSSEPKPDSAKLPKPAVQGNGTAGSISITASVPGKISKIEASAGGSVKKGDSVVVLEAMKMEIPIVAPSDGVIAGINVTVGETVESGDVLATMD